MAALVSSDRTQDSSDVRNEIVRLINNAPTTTRLPLIYVAPLGTISIVLPYNVVIDIGVNKTVRIVCYDKFSMASNSNGTNSAILHPNARICQDGEKVYGNFFSETKKTAVLSQQGVLFTMEHLKDTYMVSSNALRGMSSSGVDSIMYAKLDFDFTLRLFYVETLTGPNCVPICNDIVQRAHYEEKNGALVMMINGFHIHQNQNGDVELKCRPRNLYFSPRTGTVHLRTSNIDMAVQGDEKAYVKRGTKRIHVSRSGMVVSDGYCTTSMDHFGRIVSTT